jgi:16S rRNA (adenine1518-N6/adenine1519-N6)-dimethyltransferase
LIGGVGLESIFKPGVTRRILSENEIKPLQSLGQNFLIDGNILDKIVEAAELTEEDQVIEIGPGLGSLTQSIADICSKVIAIEVDERLVRVLKDLFLGYHNLEIIHGDVLKEDLKALMASSGGAWKVVANLPYYITSPVLSKLLEAKSDIDRIVVMVQREVALRMLAKPGNKDYGAFTLFVQYHCDLSIVHNVPSTAFYPRPDVSSSVVLLEVLKTPRVHVDDEDLLFRIIRASFGKRRKIISNALSNTPYLAFDKDFILRVLKEAGIDSKARAEDLTLEEFALISQIARLRSEGENSGFCESNQRSYEH